MEYVLVIVILLFCAYLNFLIYFSISSVVTSRTSAQSTKALLFQRKNLLEGRKRYLIMRIKSSAKQKAMEFINNRDSKFLVNIHPVRKNFQDLLQDKSTKDDDHAILKLILEELLIVEVDEKAPCSWITKSKDM